MGLEITQEGRRKTARKAESILHEGLSAQLCRRGTVNGWRACHLKVLRWSAYEHSGQVLQLPAVREEHGGELQMSSATAS